MNTFIAEIILLLCRVIIPLVITIGCGEIIQRKINKSNF